MRKRPLPAYCLEHQWVVNSLASSYYESPPGNRAMAIERLLDPISMYRVFHQPCLHIPPLAPPIPRKSDGQPLFPFLSEKPRTEAEAQEVARRLDAVKRRNGGGVIELTMNSPSDEVNAVALSSSFSSLSFSRPADTYTAIAVQKLTPEEKGATGSAVGIRARMAHYMSRQQNQA